MGLPSLPGAAEREQLYRAYFAGPKAATAKDTPEGRVFVDGSGNVKFEQPDNEATVGIGSLAEYLAILRGEGPRMEGDPAATLSPKVRPLGDILQHETMYKDYPQLRDAPLLMLPFSDKYNVAAYHSPEALEVQHAGAAGDNPNYIPEILSEMSDPVAREQVYSGIYYPAGEAAGLNPVGAIAISPGDGGREEAYGLDLGPTFTKDFSEALRRALIHEAQHNIDRLEGQLTREGRGTTPGDYLSRPNELTAYTTMSRVDMPEEERYGDIPALEAFFRDNANWFGEVGDILGPVAESPEYRQALHRLLLKQAKGE